MVRLEDLQAGAQIRGLAPEGLARVVNVEWFGDQAAKVRKVVRFHASADLDPSRVGRDAGVIAEEIIQHLETLRKSKVRVTLDIEADVPDGVPDSIQRIVTENADSLKFRSHGFESE